MSFSNKVAIVTGGSKGIGEAIAVRLSSEGCKVAIIGRNLAAAQAVAEKIQTGEGTAIAIKADVAKKTEVEAMVASVIKEWGRVDILINSAGMSVIGASAGLEESRWRAGIDVMLTGVFFCSQAAGREMIRQKYGKIINIASINGIVAFPERACYCAAKGGVIALTKALGSEWARYNINVNAIAPGYVETDLVKDLAAAGTLDTDELAARTPAGRLAMVQEIAGAVVFLSSDEAKYIQGQTIIMDGGWTAFGYLESWLKKNQNTR